MHEIRDEHSPDELRRDAVLNEFWSGTEPGHYTIDNITIEQVMDRALKCESAFCRCWLHSVLRYRRREAQIAAGEDVPHEQ